MQWKECSVLEWSSQEEVERVYYSGCDERHDYYDINERDELYAVKDEKN